MRHGWRCSTRPFSLRVPPGTSLALVGASGSGKSTLARLIAGLGEPSRGRITVGDTEDPHSPTCYLVTQEVHLFGGTLADNLSIARPTATDAELRQSLREVGADWALDLESGLGTVLGHGEVAERGTHGELLSRAGEYAALWHAYTRTPHPPDPVAP
ncbi:ATP-binding cassette domain-containing protein [Streptomyces sp. NPDC088251]|uniref:ATP-binding cassette domain-containing protein n=1 Tax=unclassified Streptomyces TaxID=2593676 RepID=UPI00381E3C3B